MGASSEAGTASSSLLSSGRKKGNYRDYYVNSLPFTICMATFAVMVAGSLAVGASMLVAGGAKEAQELSPVDSSLKSNVYGSKHAGVGFANYVVGNEVQSFWKKEMGGKATTKVSDPFASFLLKNKKKSNSDDDSSSDDSDKSDDSDDSDAESPQKEADDAQPVDTQHHKIGGAPATNDAMQHAKDVALAHQDEDKNADKGAEHLLRLIRTGRSTNPKAGEEPKLHPGMFHENHRGRHKAVASPSTSQINGIESSSAHVRASRGEAQSKEGLATAHPMTAQLLAQQRGLVVTAGRNGIPELHVGGAHAARDSARDQSARDSSARDATGHAVGGVRRMVKDVTKADQDDAMKTLRDMQKDALQRTPGHVEPVRGAAQEGVQGAAPPQRSTESYYAYKFRIAH